MVGGTTNTAQIYKASLGRSENRFRFKKEENKSPVTHELEVSLDRADNIIEGAPPSFSEPGSTRCHHEERSDEGSAFAFRFPASEPVRPAPGAPPSFSEGGFPF